MASRIVAIGPAVESLGRLAVVKGLELLPLEAETLTLGEQAYWRVALTLYSGDLADATVLVRKRAFVDEVIPNTDQVAWALLKRLFPLAREIEVCLPLEVGAPVGGR